MPSAGDGRVLDSSTDPRVTIVRRPPRHLVRSPPVKKGRHRRFEEARKLKQAGPTASDLGLGASRAPKNQDDEYAAIAEKYGVVFDDDDQDLDEDDSNEDFE